MSDDQPKKRGSKAKSATPDEQPETQPEPLEAVDETFGGALPNAFEPALDIVAETPPVEPREDIKGLYGKGYKRDTHDTSQDLTIRHLLGARTQESPPECLAMEQYIAGVMGVKDQGQSGRCVAYALARCAQLRCAVMGVPLKEFPSVNCLYTVGRAIERAREHHLPADQPLKDEGSIPMCVVDGANDYGVASESRWPSTLEDMNREPDPEKLLVASQMKMPGRYRITTTGAQRIEDVKQAIAAGYPVLVGVQVDPPFEAYSGGLAQKTPPIPKAVTKPDLKRDLGGHGLCLFGYKTFAGGVLLFRGCNSWGEEWGDYGLFWADVTWICDDSVMDIIVITCDPSHHAVAA